VLRVWSASVELGIDFVERSHYGVRLELRSAGPARNATHSVNKVLLQQAAAEHLRRFGKNRVRQSVWSERPPRQLSRSGLGEVEPAT